MDHWGHQGQAIYLRKVILKAFFFLNLMPVCGVSALLNWQSKLQLILGEKNTAPS